MVPKINRLSASQIQLILKTGTYIKNHASWYGKYTKNPNSTLQIAIIVPKKHIKKATKRNKIKRKFRQGFIDFIGQNKSKDLSGFQLVCIVNNQDLSSLDLVKTFNFLAENMHG